MRKLIALAFGFLLISHNARSQIISLNDLIDRGAVESASIWQWAGLFDRKIIKVCWENPYDKYLAEMGLVRASVKSAWADNSALEFDGWEKCAPSSPGIHLVIRDAQPEARWLGRGLNGKKNGLILNFSFHNWKPFCTNGDRFQWIADIAVHEFGHAIAFTHEHNRDDTPSNCTAKKSGTIPDKVLTDWDPKSEMNYCYCDDDALLSELDIKSVKILYP